MCGRLVIERWNWEIDSVESFSVYAASALRSSTKDLVENPSLASEDTTRTVV